MGTYTETLSDLEAAMDTHRSGLEGGDSITLIAQSEGQDAGRFTLYRSSHGVVFGTPGEDSQVGYTTFRFGDEGLTTSTDISHYLAENALKRMWGDGHDPDENMVIMHFEDRYKPIVNPYGNGEDVISFMQMAATRIRDARPLYPADK